jgi:type III secretory pathway lipoprotein EscJ
MIRFINDEEYNLIEDWLGNLNGILDRWVGISYPYHSPHHKNYIKGVLEGVYIKGYVDGDEEIYMEEFKKLN